MRTLPKIIGACAIAALASSAAWAASGPVQHRLTVWIPGGGTEQITYAGDVAPKVTIMPSDFANSAFMPATFWSPLGVDAVWMPADQIAAVVDNDMAAMIRRIDTMIAAPAFNGVTEADLSAMPAGSQSYSVVSTMTGNNVCTRSVEITSARNGGAPKVVRHSSGNCAVAPDNPVLFQPRSAQGGPLMTIHGAAPDRNLPHQHI